MTADAGCPVPLARCSTGTAHWNAVTLRKPLTIAFMELLFNDDSNLMKAKWKGFGFRDVSPLWAAEKDVPSFNDEERLKRWTEYQAALGEVDADWYYLSGHHAPRFEYLREHPDRTWPVGFFNEPYHDGAWLEGTDTRKPAELFVSTSRVPASPGALDRDENPVFARPRPNCKGVILMGCNTLRYRRVRRTLRKVFPNAVIIGYLGTTPKGIGAYTPIHRKCRKGFFENPPQNRNDFFELASALNSLYGRRTLAIQFQETVYGVDKKSGIPTAAGTDDDAEIFFERFGII